MPRLDTATATARTTARAAARSLSGVSDLGAYLREQRENAQLSVRQLSRAAGISNPYLSQIERGLRRPSAEILSALAGGLQVSAESLYVRAGLLEPGGGPGGEARVPGPSGADGPPGTVGHPGGSAVDARVALARDPRLTPRQRRILVELYDSFVETDAASAPAHPGAPGAGAPDRGSERGSERWSECGPEPVVDAAGAASHSRPGATDTPARPLDASGRGRRSRRSAASPQTPGVSPPTPEPTRAEDRR